MLCVIMVQCFGCRAVSFSVVGLCIVCTRGFVSAAGSCCWTRVVRQLCFCFQGISLGPEP